jgi:hypothetical protein
VPIGEAGIAKGVNDVPCGVIRPSALLSCPNQRFPSGPATMTPAVTPLGKANSVMSVLTPNAALTVVLADSTVMVTW